MSSSRLFLAVGAFSGMTVVMLGAFGAHGLDGHISARLMNAFEKAIDYQAIHTLLLLAIGILAQQRQDSCLRWSGYLAIVGILLFSGSLYLLAITGIGVLGAITPFGGTAFILSWGCLFKAAVQIQQS